ncbi:alpha-ketoglutarate-dependent dioxygenase alkB homolog 7, mitochondrial-like [Oppia nitens]|uniref:alpha-ketoglutarate-dependent dioxygenase alkB homolog 7, mitochondrial-like n=1 Tax=Oppia nitens TaxID=1686743 RepID=UPI0023DC0A9A|nr:alpha-ketoglutarate-dependent dioxygenase alkB homolog 7, mitochondrial-like [Oppia nitens]
MVFNHQLIPSYLMFNTCNAFARVLPLKTLPVKTVCNVLRCLSNATSNRDQLSVTTNVYTSYLDSNSQQTLDLIKDSFKVIDDFVTEDEEQSLFKEIEPYVKRLRYETSHWDDAIHEYRETERSKWTQENQRIIDRVRNTAFPAGVAPIRSVHVLDLAKTGVIKAHVDAVRFCGDTIAGISLLSSSVMRLADETDNTVFVDALIKRRSLYIMSGIARYKFTHEILGQQMSVFKGQAIPRDRRISVICRNQPDYSQREDMNDNNYQIR